MRRTPCSNWGSSDESHSPDRRSSRSPVTSRFSRSSSSSRSIWKSSSRSTPTDWRSTFCRLLGGIVVASLFTGRWVGRVGSRIPMTVGCLMAGLGVILTFAIIGPHVDLSTLGWTMVSPGSASVSSSCRSTPAPSRVSARALRYGVLGGQHEPRTRRRGRSGDLGFDRERATDGHLTARLVQLGIPASFRQLVITAVTTGQTKPKRRTQSGD